MSMVQYALASVNYTNKLTHQSSTSGKKSIAMKMCMCAHMDVYVNACPYMCVCMYVYMNVCLCACVCMCACMYE